jgi:hypothetical protein
LPDYQQHDDYDRTHGDDCHYHWDYRDDGNHIAFYHHHDWAGNHNHLDLAGGLTIRYDSDLCCYCQSGECGDDSGGHCACFWA